MPGNFTLFNWKFQMTDFFAYFGCFHFPYIFLVHDELSGSILNN